MKHKQEQWGIKMEHAIETEGLTKYYGDFLALEKLDLTVQKGEILGFLGPNGAGKTTTIRCLLGLIGATSGTSRIFGLDAKKDKVAAHRHVAYVPGEANLWPNLTGAETLELLANIQGGVDEDYRTSLIDRFKFDPNKKVRAYSKGNRQKINLIAAFASRADLLILDEPTSGLDPLMGEVFRECVLEAKRNGQTVFLSSHILGEVEALCDRVAVLRAGKLVELGTLDEMRHLSSVTIDATFKGQPPKVSHIKGVSKVVTSKGRLTCQVQGSIDALLAEVAKAHPISFLSREPSLEELFLSLYGEVEEKA
ncbi:MAG TPA: ABC transporter ATP-binding protein [Candidatus Saccharimonadales bacterium]|nr:ABC transporter ATP-binding protein [Candidatus Saccharimonadales bacterium]